MRFTFKKRAHQAPIKVRWNTWPFLAASTDDTLHGMEPLKIGPTHIYIEGDLVYSVANGVTPLEYAKRYLDIAAEVGAKHGHILLLTDVTRGFGLSPEVRQYTAEWAKSHRIKASALFGANSTTRAMLTLVTRAMKLISRSEDNTRFFATEAEARAWLDPYRLPEFRKKHS